MGKLIGENPTEKKIFNFNLLEKEKKNKFTSHLFF